MAGESAESNTEEANFEFETVSEKKLKRNLSSGDDIGLYSKASKITGYRLIDLECLNAGLKNAHKCKGGEYLHNFYITMYKV